MFAGAAFKATRRMALRAAPRKVGIFFACNFGKTARRRFSPGTDGRHLIFRELLRCAVWEKTKGEGMMKPLEGIDPFAGLHDGATAHARSRTFASRYSAVQLDSASLHLAHGLRPM